MSRIYYILIVMLGMVSCTDEIFNTNTADDIEFADGEAVRFITNVPSMQKTTRGYTLDSELLTSYSTIQDEYAISVQMYQEGNTATPVGTCTYKPVTTVAGYDEDGTLTPSPVSDETQLYWITNQKGYAFKASAGTETLAADQSTKALWIAQDKLEGYGYTPLKKDDKNVDDIGALNFHTNKEWGALNREWRTLDNSNQMLSTEHYKAIPLFMQHQRSWITLKLKAGNGVSRESLKFEEAQKNGTVSFYSYKGDATEPFVVSKSWAQPDTVNYGKDKNGAAVVGYETTAYNVIVEPHDYYTHADDHKIASISLSGLKFTFSASNDHNYEASKHEENQNHDVALEAMNAYKLEPGKHLTITAILTTDRVVFITAWIEDWTTIATTTICDDYGLNGDPILINSRADLIDFLSSTENNKSGNVAIVVANSLDLDKKITTTYYQEGEEIPEGKKVGDVKGTEITDEAWTGTYTLNATLNMAGARFDTSNRFLAAVSSSGSIINGTFVVNHDVESAIAGTNEGTLERLDVAAATGVKASRAGMVVTNHGTIYQCSSSLPVYGTNDDATKTVYVGGIAAESNSKDGTLMPVIDGCTVTSSVKGSSEHVVGGGIVGNAEGRISNNVFEYGITLLQNSQKFKNIIGNKSSGDLRAQNNWWPTKVKNAFTGADNTNANTTSQYDNVLDCQEELAEMLKNTNNQSDKKYRISNSFTVSSEYWNLGEKHDDTNYLEGNCKGNLYCELDGNDKIITLDGNATVKIPTTIDNQGKATATEEKTTCAMLFSNITGSVRDLTLYLAKPLIAKPATNDNTETGILNATDAIAPLAYAVTGPTAEIKNIKVKMADDAYIQAALSAGVVCWAYNGANVDGCQVKGKILSWVPTSGSISNDDGGSSSDARRYAGGIVGLAAKATIKDCMFHTENGTLLPAMSKSATIYYGGILGGTTPKSINNTKENPAVSISECTSWLVPEDNTDTRKGAILGFSIWYDEQNHPQDGTTVSTCQGNWWNTTYPGVAKVKDGQTIEGVIGSCNSYTPTKDNNF